MRDWHQEPELCVGFFVLPLPWERGRRRREEHLSGSVFGFAIAAMSLFLPDFIIQAPTANYTSPVLSFTHDTHNVFSVHTTPRHYTNMKHAARMAHTLIPHTYIPHPQVSHRRVRLAVMLGGELKVYSCVSSLGF